MEEVGQRESAETRRVFYQGIVVGALSVVGISVVLLMLGCGVYSKAQQDFSRAVNGPTVSQQGR